MTWSHLFCVHVNHNKYCQSWFFNGHRLWHKGPAKGWFPNICISLCFLGTPEPLRVPSILLPSFAKNLDQCRSAINRNRATSDQAYNTPTKRGQCLLSSIQNTPTKTGLDQIGPDWNRLDRTKPRWTEPD